MTGIGRANLTGCKPQVKSDNISRQQIPCLLTYVRKQAYVQAANFRGNKLCRTLLNVCPVRARYFTD